MKKVIAIISTIIEVLSVMLAGAAADHNDSFLEGDFYND